MNNEAPDTISSGDLQQLLKIGAAKTYQTPQQPTMQFNQGNPSVPSSVSAAQPPQEAPKKDLPDKAAGLTDSIFGGGKIGQWIGTKLAKFITPKQYQQFIDPSTPSAEQIGGDFLKIGTTLATALIPGAGAGAGGLARLGASAALGAGAGAANGAAEALRSDQGIGDVLKQGAGTAAFGALLGPAFEFAPEALSQGASKLMNRVFKVTAAESRQQLQGKLTSPGATLLKDNPIFRTTKGLLKMSTKRVGQVDDQIGRILENKAGSLGTSEVIGKAVEQTMKDFDGNVNQNAIEQIFFNKNLPFEKVFSKEGINFKEANKLRSIIDREFIGSSKWLSSNPDSLSVSVLKNVAGVLREAVKGSDERLPTLFNDLRGYITAKSLLEETVSRKQGFLTRLLEGGLLTGGVVAATGGGSIIPAVAGGAAVAGIRGATSGLAKSTTATALNLAGKALNKAPGAIGNQVLNAKAQGKSADTEKKNADEVKSFESEITGALQKLSPAEQDLFLNLIKKGSSSQ